MIHFFHEKIALIKGEARSAERAVRHLRFLADNFPYRRQTGG